MWPLTIATTITRQRIRQWQRRRVVAAHWRRKGVATAAWATGPSGRNAARAAASGRCIDIAKSSNMASAAADPVRHSSSPSGAAASATVMARRAILIGKWVPLSPFLFPLLPHRNIHLIFNKMSVPAGPIPIHEHAQCRTNAIYKYNFNLRRKNCFLWKTDGKQLEENSRAQ